MAASAPGWDIWFIHCWAMACCWAMALFMAPCTMPPISPSKPVGVGAGGGSASHGSGSLQNVHVGWSALDCTACSTRAPQNEHCSGTFHRGGSDMGSGGWFLRAMGASRRPGDETPGA